MAMLARGSPTRVIKGPTFQPSNDRAVGPDPLRHRTAVVRTAGAGKRARARRRLQRDVADELGRERHPLHGKQGPSRHPNDSPGMDQRDTLAAEHQLHPIRVDDASFAHGSIQPSSRDQGKAIANSTVTVIGLGVGTPFSIVGTNCHWRTASTTARSS